jgi:hypothetical protein
VAALAIAITVLTASSGVAGGVRSAVSATATRTARVTVEVGRTWLRVPRSYLGIAVENNDLLKYESSFATFTRLLGVLRPPGETAPIVMRLGGESADSSFWENDDRTIVARPYRQGHPYSVTPAWMSGLAALVKSAGLKVILDLNLAAHSPEMAGQVAGAALHGLPARSVIGFELGNEPDLYRRGFIGLTRAEHGGRGDWGFSFTIADYVSLFGAYVPAIERAFPGAPMVGPSSTSGDPGWVSGLASSREASKLTLVTAHQYPFLNGCATPGESTFPAATKYLKQPLVHGAARLSRRVVAEAKARGLSLRMTEVGSSYCHGIPGQTDTFATALWAPDQLFTLLAAGVNGVNVEVQTNHPNSSLNYNHSKIDVEPMFYGVALFARALGPGARLMRVAHHGNAQNLKIWAVRLGDGTLHLLYINKAGQNVAVRTDVPAASHPGSLERLSAPDIYSNQTVTLAGQRLGPYGHWKRRLASARVAARKGSYEVRVPAFSAALLSIPPVGH